MPETETEWAIRHSQGMATCRNERDARERLAEFTRRYEANFKIKVAPQIVCRTVTEWVVPDLTSPPGQADS